MFWAMNVEREIKRESLVTCERESYRDGPDGDWRRRKRWWETGKEEEIESDIKKKMY